MLRNKIALNVSGLVKCSHTNTNPSVVNGSLHPIHPEAGTNERVPEQSARWKEGQIAAETSAECHRNVTTCVWGKKGVLMTALH